MSSHRSIQWGIDLGTTNSAIAILRQDRVRVIESKFQEEVTPSAVAFLRTDGEAECEVGKKARQRLPRHPAHVATEFKQNMGNHAWKFVVEEFGVEESACDLSGRVLQELKNSLQRHGDLPPIHAAVVTVPAAFQTPQFGDTKEAGRRAGIQHVETVPEPVAAALAYGRGADTTHNPIWLAYDLGGGTFDAALVRCEDGVFSIVDHEGDRLLGGKNLDEAIVAEFLRPQCPAGLRERIVPRTPEWWTLKVAAEEMKCLLSVDDKASHETTIGGEDHLFHLRREQVEELQVRVFGRTLDLCHKLLRRNGFRASDIERVVLVGGPTMSPFLRNMIRNGASDSRGHHVEGLGIETDSSVNPLTAVAEGAAIYAAARRVPPGIVPVEVTDGPPPAVELTLSATAQVREEQVLVTGIVRGADAGTTVSDEWAVVIERLDNQGVAVWQGPPVRLDPAGRFLQHVPLADGQNDFRVQVLDASRSPVPAGNDRLQVLKDIGVGELTLRRGIGVATADGTMMWYFRKGDGLPNRSSHEFRTTVKLNRGEAGTACLIPIVEGADEKARLNAEIYTMTIDATAVPVTIPEGSTVEVMLEIDESQMMTVSASFPDYDGVDFTSSLAHITPDPERIRAEFEKQQKNVELFRSVESMSDAVAGVVDEIRERHLLEDIMRQLEEGSVENHEAWQRARDHTLEVAQLLDPVYNDVDELLAWEPHLRFCDRNVDKALEIVGEVSGLSTDWNDEFHRIIAEYRDACTRRDRVRSEEIAYSELPAHFQESPVLRERVGGMAIVKGESMTTVKSDGHESTIN